jgi:hypothetical protein
MTHTKNPTNKPCINLKHDRDDLTIHFNHKSNRNDSVDSTTKSFMYESIA